MSDNYLTAYDAAAEAGVSLTTLYTSIRTGALRASQPNGARGRYRISTEDLQAWLNRPAVPQS